MFAKSWLRQFPWILVVVPFAAAGCGQSKAMPPGATDVRSPVLTVDAIEKHLGSIVQGSSEAPIATFLIGNDGNAVLEIGSIGLSCGCTTAQLEKKRIGAGERAQLVVKLARPAAPTTVSSTISLVTNDPHHRKATLRVVWEMIPLLAVEPAELSIGRRKSGSAEEREATLYANDVRFADTAPPGIRCHPAFVRCGFEPMQWAPTSGRKAIGRLRISIDDSAGPTEGSGAIDLEYAALGAKVQIPVQWQLAERLTAAPPRHYAGSLVRPSQWKAKSILQLASNTAFELRLARPVPNWLLVEFDKGRRTAHVVEIRLGANLPKGILMEKVLLESNVDGKPRTELEIAGMLP